MWNLPAVPDKHTKHKKNINPNVSQLRAKSVSGRGSCSRICTVLEPSFCCIIRTSRERDPMWPIFLPVAGMALVVSLVLWSANWTTCCSCCYCCCSRSGRPNNDLLREKDAFCSNHLLMILFRKILLFWQNTNSHTREDDATGNALSLGLSVWRRGSCLNLCPTKILRSGEEQRKASWKYATNNSSSSSITITKNL